MAKVLFVYPNQGSELRVPLAISILISAIRKAGHEVKLFDTTFFAKDGQFCTDNDKMAKMGTHKQTDLNKEVGEVIPIDPKVMLNLLIKSYKPDIICCSIVERNFQIAKDLLFDIDTPVLVGGIMPTIAPEFVIKEDWVDYICVGEGEIALPELLNSKGEIPKHIANIWSKEKANPLRPLISLNDVPEQDWTDFDRRHLLKPFMGKIYRGGSFEFSRGCFKSCTFCVAPKLREVQKGCGHYHRTKHPHTLIREIEHKIKDYDLNMLSFSDTDFLSGVPKPIMSEFLSSYSNRVGLPFTMQTSVRTLLDEDILTLLRKAQCCAISVGVESGSEKIQAQVLRKVIPAEMIKKAFDLCRKHELRVTANYMVGLPFETRDDIRKTIELNRLINPPSVAVTFFTPYMGTELYDLCIKEGFYKPFQLEKDIYDSPPLEMPQLSQVEIKKSVRDFIEDFKQYQRDFSIV